MRKLLVITKNDFQEVDSLLEEGHHFDNFESDIVYIIPFFLTIQTEADIDRRILLGQTISIYQIVIQYIYIIYMMYIYNICVSNSIKEIE